MNRKRKLSFILSVFFAIAFVFSAVFLPINAFGVKAAEGTELKNDRVFLPYVNLKQKNLTDGKWSVEVGLALDLNSNGIIDGSDTTVTQYMKEEFGLFYSAKLWVRTVDVTAVAEFGDYQAVDEVVEIGRYQSTGVTVSVANNGLQVGKNAHEFYIEIYKVEVNALKEGYSVALPETVPASSRLRLYTGNEMTVNTGGLSFGDYNADVLNEMQEINYFIGGDDWWSSKTYTVDFGRQASWWEKLQYMSARNMIKLGVSLSKAELEIKGLVYVEDSVVKIRLRLGDKKIAEWHIDFVSNWTEKIGIEHKYEGNMDGDYQAYTWLHNDVSVKKGLVVIDDLQGELAGESNVKMDVEVAYGDKLRSFTNGSGFVPLPVNVAPEIIQAKLGQLRIDENGRLKLGYSVRFNEPLQFKRYGEGVEVKTPVIKAMINGLSANPMDFVYVEGAGTDTFYFEADITDNKERINSIKISDAVGFNDVVDYAPYSRDQQPMQLFLSGGALKGWEKISSEKYPCAIDLRTPEINMNKKVPTTVQKSHTVTVGTSSVGETGMLYYAWTENDPTVDPTLPTSLNSSPVLAEGGYQTIPSPASVTGKRWLYVKAVSALGRECRQPVWVGPYYFDNEPPEIEYSLSEEENSTFKQKTFDITVRNNLSGAEKYAPIKNLQLMVYSDEKMQNAVANIAIPLTGSQLEAAETTVRFSLTAEAVGFALGSSEEYGERFVCLVATDQLENRTEGALERFYFDTREMFGVERFKEGGDPNLELEEFAEGGLLAGTLGENRFTIDLSKTSEADAATFRFKATDAAVKIDIESFVSVNSGESVNEALYSKTCSENEIAVLLKQGFIPGLYSIIFRDTADGSDKKSLVQYVYITNGKADLTSLYCKAMGGTVITNRVYQLSADVPYYYKNDLNAVQTQNYGNTKKPASFSSREEAKEFVYYNEILDLYAVCLTEEMANNLNDGILANYRKANSSEIAEAGQVWIRYKDRNWHPSSTTSTWVYYYYSDGLMPGEELEINLSALSGTLFGAIETVSNTICAYGSYVDLVKAEDLDSHGAPKLEKSQIYVDPIYTERSKSGSRFTQYIEYDGDEGMYQVINDSAPLSSTLTVEGGEHTRIFFRQASMEYRPLKIEEGKTLAESIDGGSDVYYILELDEGGVSEYTVYVDVDAPVLNISWVKQSGSSEPKKISESFNGETLSGKSFYIHGFDLGEYDRMSFVAIYKYTSQGEGDLLKVYRVADLENGEGVLLDDGKYHIHVSDRSGNDYAFVFQVKADPFVCSVKEVKNTYVQIEMNRSESEIESYLVYLNGKLITTDYNERRFTESGYYQILIEDIYGNVYDEYYNLYEYEVNEDGEFLLDENGNRIPKLKDGEKIKVTEKLMVDGEEVEVPLPAYYSFIRDLPSVTWKYQNEDGIYENYDETNTVKMRVTKSGDINYVVSTSAYLQFLPMSGCTYTILSGAPRDSVNDYTKWVTLKALTPFSMKVYYEKHPETYVIYTCNVDASAPNVAVSYQESSYKYYEYDEMAELSESGVLLDGDATFTPSFLGFMEHGEQTVYVENGEVVFSKYFNLNVSDESGVKLVEVYLDGELLLSRSENFSNIILSRYGGYEIRAVDGFGNISFFSFVNDRTSKIEYKIDGEDISPAETPTEWFDYDNLQFNRVDYGNESIAVKMPSGSEAYFYISDKSGERYYLAYSVENGEVFSIVYQISVKDGKVENAKLQRSESLINLRGSDIIPEKLYPLVQIDVLGIAVFVSCDAAERVSFTVAGIDESPKTFVVEARISTGYDNAPYYVKAEISNVAPTVQFKHEDGSSPESATTNVNTNRAFRISSDLDVSIDSVRVFFSKTGQFESYVTVYDGIYHDVLFEEEGMYRVEVINVYGVKNDYTVIISSSFIVTARSSYADETEVLYTSDYTMDANNGVIYSNRSVEFVAYSTKVRVSVNGEEIDYFNVVGGHTEIYIENVGESVVCIWDEYGNVFEKTVSICLQAVSEQAELLSGFNSDALRLDEGYTNKRITVEKQALDQNGVAYVEIKKGGKSVIVYDLIGEEKVTADEADLTECIGTMGDGEYRIIFRDVYGNKLEKTVNYCGTPTLTVTRTTVNSASAEIYPMDVLIEKGVWTNASASFIVTATEYELTVDGYENVTTVSYDSKTKNEYSVSYLDEYGFKYDFTVYLFRQEVEIDVTDDVSVFAVDDVYVTRDDISVQFTESARCTYVYNGGEQTEYTVGEKLYHDGLYRFKVVDIAGNVSTYTVEKDSVVEYQLNGSGVNEVLLNGGVTNGSSVRFVSDNSDGAYIKKVFFNGELIEYTDTEFTERGKWELMVADRVGNQSYFRFYILRGRMDSFTYGTPNDYIITEVEWSLQGTTVMATEAIKENGKLLQVTESGSYKATMRSTITGDVRTFTFVIDKTPPQVSLVGCAENEKTLNNVSVKGCEVGDTVYVYRDEKLVKTVRISNTNLDVPVISEGGKYKIVVENEAGITTELSFERKHIPNVAGSVLIIVIALAAVIALLVGLVWRNHSKTDK